RGPSGSSSSSTSPRHPSRTPKTSYPRWNDLRPTARITALSPGQSPPPVRMPIRFATREIMPKVGVEERGGNHVSPTSPLLFACGDAGQGEPLGGQSPPSAVNRVFPSPRVPKVGVEPTRGLRLTGF